jgi:hypothetical protein
MVVRPVCFSAPISASQRGLGTKPCDRKSRSSVRATGASRIDGRMVEGWQADGQGDER